MQGENELATSIVTLVSYVDRTLVSYVDRILVNYIDSSTRERSWSDMDWMRKKKIYVTNNICQHYVIFLFCMYFITLLVHFL